VNLAAVDEVILEKSRASFREEVQRALHWESTTWWCIQAVLGVPVKKMEFSSVLKVCGLLVLGYD
jgi:hypothetical protein